MSTIDLLSLHLVGGRIRAEASYALPHHYYRNPANSIKFRDTMKTSAAIQQDTESFSEMTPFNKLLSIWSNWVSLADQAHPGGDANPQDTKDFMRVGEAVEVMINCLPRHQWWAIRKSRGIASVWIFPNLSLADALSDAEKILTPKMQNHIATRRYFN